MKKILLFIAILLGGAAYAGPMANVEYVHKIIKQQWDIDVPYNPALENPKVAANMKYLLTAVDVANKILNGTATSDYGNSKYATQAAADTIATNEAVDRLIKKDTKFFVTTTSTVSSFSFSMSAKGTFMVDWGDGNIETISRTNTTETTYSHTYVSAGEYKIGIDGKATEYSTDTQTAAISFSYNGDIARIEGSLGAIFSTIGDGSANGQQPRFYSTFYWCYRLTGTIPENLFAGISGAPTQNMFYKTFFYSGGLTGSIPEKLFAGISGAPAKGMFGNTFSYCSTLTGNIPENLFAGISGAPAPDMFNSTFNSCIGLTGTIPEKLFSGIQGAPAKNMFNATFYGCSGLTSIPEKLFAGISGAPAEYMFGSTFRDCTKLTSIPEKLFAGIQGAPAEGMFCNTFYNCHRLTGNIPGNLFGNISGPAQSYMFQNMFNGCTSLSGPSARINGTPLYEIWPSATSTQVGRCYENVTSLSDYDEIPNYWKV